MAETTGLLLVHGIGSQSRASVLTSTCDALVTWLRHQYEDESVTFGPTSLRLGEDSSAGPSTVRVCLPDGNTWLIAESRWAESFVAPSFQRIMGWTLTSVLRAGRLEAGYLLGPNKTIDPGDNGGPLAPARPYETSRAFRYVKGVLILTALPVVLMTLASTSVLRLLPPLREQVARMQSVLSATIGDSFVFVSAGSGSASIVQQVRRDIEWMRSQKVDRIVVAAHSQGAAVTYEALNQWSCPLPATEPHHGCSSLEVDLLTYGSGLDKLNSLRDVARTRTLTSIYAVLVGILGTAALTFTGLAMIDAVTKRVDSPKNLAIAMVVITAFCITLTVTAWSYALFRQLGKVKRLWTVGKYVFLVGGPLAILVLILKISPDLALPGVGLTILTGLLAAGLMIDATKDADVTVPVMARSWVDVRSTSDPVASSSTTTPAKRVDLVVHNLRSAMYDHITYWDNWSEFVPIVINVMAGQNSAFAVPRFWTLRERSRRFEWTWVLAGNRAVFAVLSLAAVVWALTSLSAIGNWTVERYRFVVGLLGNDVAPITSTAAATLIGAGAVVLLFFIVYQFLATSWHTWQRLTARRQIQQLSLLAARREDWPTWEAAAPCTRRDVEPPTDGWLVLKQTNGTRQLWWFGDERAVAVGCELATTLRIRPWWRAGLNVHIGSAHFTSRSLRSVAHLSRSHSEPDHR